jgi:hypothetical protein
MKQPWVQQALSLYAYFEKGITPNNAGLRGETAFYRDCMMLLQSYKAAAEVWYMEHRPKR